MLFQDQARQRKAFPKAIKLELFKEQKEKCMYCGRKPGMDLMHIDHKTPFSKGGSDLKKNLQVLCGTCNTRKGDLNNRQFRTRFKVAGVPQTQVPPTKIIPQSLFDAVAEKVADRKAKQSSKTRKARQNDPFGLFI